MSARFCGHRSLTFPLVADSFRNYVLSVTSRGDKGDGVICTGT